MINLIKSLNEAHAILEADGIAHALIGGFALAVYGYHRATAVIDFLEAYKNDPSRELQDKADIQQLLAVPHIDLNRVKKYADLFGEWEVIKKIKDVLK